MARQVFHELFQEAMNLLCHAREGGYPECSAVFLVDSQHPDCDVIRNVLSPDLIINSQELTRIVKSWGRISEFNLNASIGVSLMKIL